MILRLYRLTYELKQHRFYFDKEDSKALPDKMAIKGVIEASTTDQLINEFKKRMPKDDP